MKRILRIVRQIHKVLERRLGVVLPWFIYGVPTAVVFRLFVLKQKPGDMLADLLWLVFNISLIALVFKILQLRLRKPPQKPSC